MKSITLHRFAVIVLAAALSFLSLTPLAFADHSEETEDVSHATTAHSDANHDGASVAVPTSVSGSDRIEKMEQLIAALTQLIELLQHQMEHTESKEDYDQHNEEDHE